VTTDWRTRAIVGDFAVGGHGLDDRLPVHQGDVDACLAHFVRRNELNPTTVVLADGVVLWPRQGGQRPGSPFSIRARH
jgi:hypothetical protein